MKKIKSYQVKDAAENIHFETLDVEEAKRYGQHYHNEYQIDLEIYEELRMPTDHTKRAS